MLQKLLNCETKRILSLLLIILSPFTSVILIVHMEPHSFCLSRYFQCVVITVCRCNGTEDKHLSLGSVIFNCDPEYKQNNYIIFSDKSLLFNHIEYSYLGFRIFCGLCNSFFLYVSMFLLYVICVLI